jgi:hypothetical protein
MGITDTVRNGRRGKTVKETTVDSTEKSAVAVDKTANPKSEDEKDFKALPAPIESAQKGAIQVHHSGEIEVAETIFDGGLRPIATSDLEIYGTILNRPISASHLRVVNTDTIPGHRPIFASDLKVLNSIALAGNRPIVASDPHLMAASGLPGGRPIASNEIDDGEILMGYID